jgi:hypothetical protein
MTFYDDVLAHWTKKDAQTRAKQRWKYFEPDGYRQLSEVLGPYEYTSWTEIYMLISYLQNCETPENRYLTSKLRQQIEENKNNPDINWNNIFDYFDERNNTETAYKHEVVEVMRVLEPYREELTTYQDSFVLY